MFNVNVFFSLKDRYLRNHFTVNKSHKKMKIHNELILQILSVQPKPNVAYSSVPQRSIVIKKLLKTHQLATLLHGVTCLFIIKNMGSVADYESVSQTPSPAKYSLVDPALDPAHSTPKQASPGAIIISLLVLLVLC